MFAPGTGRPLLVGGLLLAVLSALTATAVVPRTPALAVLLAASWAVWLFLATFFRDPERMPGVDIVAPADGRIREVGIAEGRLVISTFMNVTNVHVNRFPLDAHIERVEEAGKGFRPAYRSDASHNLRRSYQLTTAVGAVELTQMTGVLARRLVSFVNAGYDGKKGERLGMIVLGSRVDLNLPADRTYPVVAPGQRVVAGVTTIARMKP
ncbi:MAG: phosphatidylserine decarboxylase [Thermoplasmata archaeon]|nr:phosphatidylserine decarboxylase [Thermoplasmata archaeon]